jgi:hypothetical protein
MITKFRSPTLNTTIKKKSPLATLAKQILLALIVMFVTINLLVVLFNFLLTAIGTA